MTKKTRTREWMPADLLVLDDENHYRLAELGELHREHGRLQEAEFCFRKAAELIEAVGRGTNDQLYADLQLGRVLVEADKAAEAEERLRRAVEAAANNEGLDFGTRSLIYLELGKALAAQGKRDESDRMFAQADAHNQELIRLAQAHAESMTANDNRHGFRSSQQHSEPTIALPTPSVATELRPADSKRSAPRFTMLLLGLCWLSLIVLYSRSPFVSTSVHFIVSAVAVSVCLLLVTILVMLNPFSNELSSRGSPTCFTSFLLTIAGYSLFLCIQPRTFAHAAISITPLVVSCSVFMVALPTGITMLTSILTRLLRGSALFIVVPLLFSIFNKHEVETPREEIGTFDQYFAGPADIGLNYPPLTSVTYVRNARVVLPSNVESSISIRCPWEWADTAYLVWVRRNEFEVFESHEFTDHSDIREHYFANKLKPTEDNTNILAFVVRGGRIDRQTFAEIVHDAARDSNWNWQDPWIIRRIVLACSKRHARSVAVGGLPIATTSE